MPLILHWVCKYMQNLLPQLPTATKRAALINCRWRKTPKWSSYNGAFFFFFFHLSVPQKEGGKIFFLTGWMPQGFIRRWDFSGLSFHLSQCVAPTTSPGQGLNGWKENEGVRNHLESEISQLWWREGKDGWRRREVKSHCFHQGLAKKPLRAFWRKKLEKYVLRQCGKGLFLSLFKLNLP